MGLFDVFKKKEPEGPKTLPADHGLHKEDYRAVGMVYHKQAISRIRSANPDWKKSKKAIMESDLVNRHINHYDYVNKPVDLVPEPTNPHDRNAVMVKIAGEHVGYIGQEYNSHVLEILKYGSVKYITAYITGGEYRIVFNDGTEQKHDDPLKINIRIAYSV